MTFGSKHKAWLAGTVATLLVAVSLVVFWPRSGAGGPSAERLAQGEGLYREHCASCHGANLEGEANWQQRKADGTLPAPPHDENGHTWHHPDQQLVAITKQGSAAFAPAGYQTNMLGFGDRLSDDEIRAVFDYIKSRWPPEVRARQAGTSRQSGG